MVTSMCMNVLMSVLLSNPADAVKLRVKSNNYTHTHTHTHIYIYIYIYIYIQGVSGGIVNIFGGGSLDYSE
jgi:hypothetical protein